MSRSTGKTYFINTITGESQYEFPAGPAKMYADEMDLEGMMVAAAAAGAGGGAVAAVPSSAETTGAATETTAAAVETNSAAEALVAAEKAEADRWSCMPIK